MTLKDKHIILGITGSIAAYKAAYIIRGLLKGKKVTCYPSFEQYLDGAECVNQPVVRDGNIITGMGPGAAMEFALTIVELLVGKEKVDEAVAEKARKPLDRMLELGR